MRLSRLSQLESKWVARYNRTVGYDRFTQRLFESLEELQYAVFAWLWTYNNERPSMALGGIIPKQKLHQHKLIILLPTAAKNKGISQ